MKTSVLGLALVLTLNAAAPALASTREQDTQRQEQLLKVLQEKGPKEVLKTMTDKELRQARNDLRAILYSLKSDLRQAEFQDSKKAGYVLRKVGLMGAQGAGTFAIAFFFSDVFNSRGNGTGLLISLGLLGITGAMLTVAATGQVVVWMTPQEAEAAQAKVDHMIATMESFGLGEWE